MLLTQNLWVEVGVMNGAVGVLRGNMWHHAAWVLSAFSTYLRPGSMMSIKKRNLLPPVKGLGPNWRTVVHLSEYGERSETGTSDDNIEIDTAEWTWF